MTVGRLLKSSFTLCKSRFSISGPSCIIDIEPTFGLDESDDAVSTSAGEQRSIGIELAMKRLTSRSQRQTRMHRQETFTHGTAGQGAD